MQQHGRSVGHIRDLVDLALGGDPEGRRLIRESGRHIGEVLAGAVNLLNPDALVIAGDMSKAYDILVAGLRETVYGNATALATRELQILPSTHGDQSGVIGSAAMILDHVLSARSRCRALMTSVLPNFGAADPTVNGGEPTSNAETPTRRSPCGCSAFERPRRSSMGQPMSSRPRALGTPRVMRLWVISNARRHRPSWRRPAGPCRRPLWELAE